MLFCFWLPPLEVASNSLRCSQVVVSDRAWPLSDEGHKSSAFVRRWLATKTSGIVRRGVLPPPSSSLDQSPPPLEMLLPSPSPCSTRCPCSWTIALRGSQLPAPSGRGLGGSQTRGRHDGKTVASWEDTSNTVSPRAAKAGRWRWMVRRRGRRCWWWGRWLSRHRATNPPPGFGCGGVGSSSLACHGGDGLLDESVAPPSLHHVHCHCRAGVTCRRRRRRGQMLTLQKQCNSSSVTN